MVGFKAHSHPGRSAADAVTVTSPWPTMCRTQSDDSLWDYIVQLPPGLHPSDMLPSVLDVHKSYWSEPLTAFRRLMTGLGHNPSWAACRLCEGAHLVG
jgi:hypothetical protein